MRVTHEFGIRTQTLGLTALGALAHWATRGLEELSGSLNRIQKFLNKTKKQVNKKLFVEQVSTI